MSYGTSFKADHYLRRETFNSKEMVLDRISELEKENEDIRLYLFGFMCATPKDVHIPSEDEPDNLIGSIQVEMRNQFEIYDENMNLIFELRYLLDNWEGVEKC